MIRNRSIITGSCAILAIALAVGARGQAVPGGTLDPLTIPKYVTPLVIPPVMKATSVDATTGANLSDDYSIAVRQFQQQILPGGIWNALSPACAANPALCTLPATTIWSYGPSTDPTPAVAPDPGSQFNYPAYTIETMTQSPVSVRWINDLIDPGTGGYLSHLLPVDQTLHWANPPATNCRMGSDRTDCATDDPTLYTGPVPIVTHVHGAHVDPHSDGYPEAWWLPAANDIPASYTRSGTLFDDVNGRGVNDGTLGYADYLYRQDQPATTLWYHDHSLGMTRLNVYAGPAGFWLVRGNFSAPDGTVIAPDAALDGVALASATLPGPAPVAGQGVVALNTAGAVRNAIREIPIVIQDRSFNADGSLFYPDNRAFFEGLNEPGAPQQFLGAPDLDVPFVPDSDIAPVWNPEAFFNVMVVNGVSWPSLEVAPALYRFRLLNGCNSRFLNLSLFETKIGKKKALKGIKMELPFYQIGAEQGFLPAVVQVTSGYATPLPGNGTQPMPVKAPHKDQALLMGLAERADVIVDFRGLPDGTVVTMVNTAPDSPFGGFPDVPADPATTGQVMQFVVNSALLNADDALTTDPLALVLQPEPALGVPDGNGGAPRLVSLNEGESEELCVTVDALGNTVQAFDSLTGAPLDPPMCVDSGTGASAGVPFAPKEALLGVVDTTGPVPVGVPLKWTDTTGASSPVNVSLVDGTTMTIHVTENPSVGTTEEWDVHNFTVDGHPIHLHLVRFEVVGRAPIGTPIVPGVGVLPSEAGFKDTVISYPGEVTRVKAKFDIEGLYVWHCHIVEHEDNEMMRPYVVSAP